MLFGNLYLLIFYLGLYSRAVMVNKGVFSCRVPLHLLSCFFKLNVIYPQKRVLVLELQLAPSKKTLIVGPNTTKNVKLTVRRIALRLQYAELEPSLRTKWYDSISRNNLIRVFPTYATAHRSIKKGQEREYLPNILPFGILPEYVAIVFMKETTHVGNFQNAFCYKHNDVTSLTLRKNGVAHFLNEESKGDKIEEQSHRHFLWYDEFLKCFGNHSSSIEPSKFYHDLFVFTFDLSTVPVVWENSKTDASTKLNLLSAGTIDLEVTFNAALPENLIICAIGYHKSVATFNPDGEIVSD